MVNSGTSVNFIQEYVRNLCRGSVIGIGIIYGLDGPGIECRWGRDFSHSSRPTPRPTRDTVLFSGVKRPGEVLTTHLHLAPRLQKE